MPAMRWHILFSGRVQGVGFRVTTSQVARDMGVTGWVRNLTDGRVELVGEGPAGQSRELVRRICHLTHGEVSDWSLVPAAATGEFHRFEVRADGVAPWQPI